MEVNRDTKMTRYTFQDGVYFTTGARRGAICDTNTGNVYSINEAARKIVEEKTENDSFWEKLARMELAACCDGDAGQSDRPLPTREVSLEFIWFEIVSADCNERCIHCYADSMPPTYRRAMGFVPLQAVGPAPSTRKLTYQEWLDLIREGHDLGCRQGQFIGGEPFLYRGENGETVLDLAAYAREVGYEFIEIFTNATLLTPKRVARIKDLGLNIAVSLYSDDPQVHDAVTRAPGSHRKTMAALHLLREAEVPTRVETVLMRTNQNTVESTVQLVENLGFNHKSPDVLRPKGRGDDPALMPDGELVVQYGLATRPDFRADADFFAWSRNGHNCLAGKITITDTGDVLPCIFSRTQVLGNVLANRSLSEIVAGDATQTTWHTTKDHVLVCRDCEYRYVCFDCRPLSEAAAAGRADYFTAPYPRCTYNPYTGEWGSGVWTVDENGSPRYDTRLRQVIEKTRATNHTIKEEMT